MNSAPPASRASSSMADAGKRAYAPLAIVLHWTLAILIIGTIVLGWYIVSLGRDPAAAHYVAWHQSIGLIILNPAVTPPLRVDLCDAMAAKGR